jgi:peptidoglycan/xylan/chitin deacetylase (PgdA/CDA1 family)
MINLTIAIDDVNPKKDWRILGDKTEKYLFELNKQFGAKFTLFIPSNHHNTGKLSENKTWINELQSSDIFELAAHGHYHQTSDNTRFGEMEFVDMTEQQCIDRLSMLNEEWASVGGTPKGWRNPGWMCQAYCVDHLSKNFEWVALHYQHNHNLEWGCKMLYGADGIHEVDINTHNGNIMFQSHIFGDWNHNTWNESTHQQMQLSLAYLLNTQQVTFKTISEIA